MIGALSVVRAADAQRGAETTMTVRVHGTVFDSITRTPLAGARVAFVPAGALGTTPLATTTVANGTFDIALASGRWVAAIEHPRFDSLGVDLPVRRVDVPRAPQFTLALATPSAGTLMRALCGPQEHAGDVAMVGMVRPVASASGIDSAEVLVQWVDLTLTGGAFKRSIATRAARTNRDGWYVLCDVPAGAEVMAWAERGSATTGAVVTRISGAPTRFDLAIDASARDDATSHDQPRDSGGVRADDSRRPPLRSGNARYRIVVRSLSGRPVPNARARTLGHGFVLTDARGSAVLDSLPGGSQTLEVFAVGYVPERRVVEVGGEGAPPDTIVLAGLESVLDTIRVTVGRGANGFDARRTGKVGQFITAADIERENAPSTALLLRTRDNVRITYDRRGNAALLTGVAGDRFCQPMLIVDGFPRSLWGVPVARGIPSVNWVVHPEELGGVEIYNNSAEIPPQFKIWEDPKHRCGAIVFWTRESLGLPKAPPTVKP
jgi:hypothetical protein